MARYRSRPSEGLSYRDIAIFVVVAFAGTWWAADLLSDPDAIMQRVDAVTMSEEELRAIETSVHYAGCNEVRVAGRAPLHRGQPGYGPHMDGDGDGVACEPYQ